MRHCKIATVLAAVAALSGCDKPRLLAGDPGATVTVPTGDPTGGPGGPTASLNVSGCTICHGTPDLASTGADPLVSAAPPRALSGNASDLSIGAHQAHLQDGPFRRAVECASCHLLPASGGRHPAQKQGKVSFSRLATTAWGGAPIAPTWNGTGCASTYCHGNFKNGAGANALAWTASAVVCGSCHGVDATAGPGGSHPTLSTGQNCGSCHGGSYTNTTVDLALHMNGFLDGGAESSGGASCGGCHGAIFAAMNGGTSHTSRHTLGAAAGVNDAPTDSGITWANPLSNNAAAARSCVNMCHGDHPHDLVSPATATHENNAYLDATTTAARAGGAANRIGVGGTGGTPNRTKTDYDGTQANGGLCASCHQYPVDAGHPAIGKAAFDASTHHYGSNIVGTTTYAWSYQLHDGGLFVRDCTKCHASSAEGTTPQVTASGSTVAVHFGENASLLSGTINPKGTAAGFVCYNCHGSTATPAAGAQGNRSGKDIQSQIAHATNTNESGHPANADAVHDSVNEYALATFGNALGAPAGAGQRHASCLDCHDPHQAKSGTHAQGTNLAGPPLQGAWGARLSSNPAFWTAPTSANFVKTTLTAGTDLEATLCFKCHTAYYGTLPAAPSWAPNTWAGTDVAKEFNPANVGNYGSSWSAGKTAGSFHPVLASAGSNLGVTSNIKAPWTTTSLMTCTDCHESDQTTDPGGPHGSAAKFILKGPQTTWNSGLVNGSSMPSNAFCSNCHNTSWSTSRFPAHSRNDHYVACFNCHSAIPHGAPRPGLLNPMAGTNTTNLPAIPGYDNAPPYAQPGSGSRLYLVSYPSSPTASWQQNNCGCNGTNH